MSNLITMTEFVNRFEAMKRKYFYFLAGAVCLFNRKEERHAAVAFAWDRFNDAPGAEVVVYALTFCQRGEEYQLCLLETRCVPEQLQELYNPHNWRDSVAIFSGWVPSTLKGLPPGLMGSAGIRATRVLHYEDFTKSWEIDPDLYRLKIREWLDARPEHNLQEVRNEL